MLSIVDWSAVPDRNELVSPNAGAGAASVVAWVGAGAAAGTRGLASGTEVAGTVGAVAMGAVGVVTAAGGGTGAAGGTLGVLVDASGVGSTGIEVGLGYD
jgi:hypothetical protein